MKAYKKDFGYSYAIGVFPTLELLQNKPERVTGVVISNKGESNAGVKKIRELARAHRIPIDMSTSSIENLTKSENAYAVGVFTKYSQEILPDKNHVVLVSPSDSGNLGTIVRTMAGFGFYDLAIIKPGVDIFDPKAVRASMGALFQTRFQYFDTIESYTNSFPHHLYPFMLGRNKTLTQTTFESPYSLVFGNEGAGLPEQYRKLGTAVTIEHDTNIDSLNLSMAVGIALHHVYTKGNKELGIRN